MPFQVGGVALHDGYQHYGSAARDAANGVAGLGAGGQVLAPGSYVELTRDGTEDVELWERTSGEIIGRWRRTGVDDYTQFIHCGGVACTIQHSGMKNAANGIAGLDASADVLLAQIPDALTGKKTSLNGVIASDSYGGNNTVNRAIPHGLGRIPIYVTMARLDGQPQYDIIQPGIIRYLDQGTSNVLVVTAVDDTNFYVGNATHYDQSANATGETYYWVAFS